MSVRKTVRWLGAVAILLASGTASAGTITPGKVTKERFAFGEQTVSYYLFVPKGVTVPASAPMIVLLHGSGRDGSTLVEPWKKLAEKEGIVLLGPDAQDRRGWNAPTDGPAALCALVDDVRKSVPIVNPRRIYLFGHSAGAVFVLYMAMLESEYFAAGALHAGAWSGSEDDYTQALRRRIPLALTVGDTDRFFPVKDVNSTAAVLRKAGIPVELEIIPNHDHNYYVLSGKVNDWAWNAIKKHALDEDPKYTDHQFR